MTTPPSSNAAFTPEEAATILISSLGDPSASGLGALEVPPELKSVDTFYRIRVTMLQAMGAAQPGPALDVKRFEFFRPFKGILNLPSLVYLKAEWDYLATMRDHLYEPLNRLITTGGRDRRLKVASLLRAFVASYHAKGERIDFDLLRAYVGSYTDQRTLDWLQEIWNTFELYKPQTFFRRLITSRHLLFPKN
jgi:hypothetical protein